MTTTTQTEIRPAGLEDMTVCVNMIQQLRQETFWKHMEGQDYPEVMSILLVHRLLTNPNVCLYVAEQEGKIVGLCGGEIDSHFLAPHVPLLREWAWWVVPEHRMGSIGARLWLTVLSWAKTRGVRYGLRTRVLSSEKRGKELGEESFTVKEL